MVPRCASLSLPEHMPAVLDVTAMSHDSDVVDVEPVLLQQTHMQQQRNINAGGFSRSFSPAHARVLKATWSSGEPPSGARMWCGSSAKCEPVALASRQQRGWPPRRTGRRGRLLSRS